MEISKQNITLSTAESILFNVLLIIIIAGAATAVLLNTFGTEQLASGFREFIDFYTFIPVFLIGVLLHEFLHGISWALAARKPLKSITFGFQVKSFLLYAYCQQPIASVHYKIGRVIPFLLLGILPYFYGLFTTDIVIALYGLIFIALGTNDLLIIYMLRKVPGKVIVSDHPQKTGCVVYNFDKIMN